MIEQVPKRGAPPRPTLVDRVLRIDRQDMVHNGKLCQGLYVHDVEIAEHLERMKYLNNMTPGPAGDFFSRS